LVDFDAGAAVSTKFVTRFLVATTVLGVLHHVDHVLRYDHSGWPFRSDVTPFTFSLLVYPLIAVLFLSRSRGLRLTVSLLLLVAIGFAHIFLEVPGDQYAVWANNQSRFGRAAGHPNLLNVRSPLLGVVAVSIALLLDLAVLLLPFVIGSEKREPARTPNH